MTEEQITKLASYITYLRGRLDTYYCEGDEDMCDYVGAKLEAAREIANVFDCRNEVYRKVDGLEESDD